MNVGRWLVVVTLLAPGCACGDDFADFRIPDHRLRLWDVQLSGGANRRNTGFGTVEDKDYQAFGASSTSAFWLHDSENRSTLFSLDFQGAGNRGRNNARTTDMGENSFEQRSVRELARLIASDRWYPSGGPVAAGDAGGGRVSSLRP